MNEFDILKNMFDREGVKYTIDTEQEFNDDTGNYDEVSYLCIPAMVDEFLILGFTTDGELCYVDAGADWEDYLKRRESHK